jgi:hypothetical protein
VAFLIDAADRHHTPPENSRSWFAGAPR